MSQKRILLFQFLLHYWLGELVLGTVKVQFHGVMGEMIKRVLHTECFVVLAMVCHGIWSSVLFSEIKLGYRSLYLKVYGPTSSDQDFKTEEPKRPNFKYFPPNPKSDSQTYTFLLV